MKLISCLRELFSTEKLCNILHCRSHLYPMLLLCIIAVAPVNAEDGVLRFIDAELQSTPNSIALSPGGENVYVTSLLGGFSSYTRDLMTGGLTNKNVYTNNVETGIVGLTELWRVKVSPDGLSVYVLSRGGDAITLFQRNNINGRLEFVDSYQNGNGSVQSMLRPAGFVISPDGRYVYVACSGRDGSPGALITFMRNSEGRLTFQEALTDGINELNGLVSARDIAITPDGKNLYIVSSNDIGIVQFSRDRQSGQLYFIPSALSVLGVVGGQAIVVSPDSKYVYVTRDTENILVVFNRDSVSGQLSKAEEYVGVGTSSAGYLLGVAVSPDGGQVMLTSYDIPQGNSFNAVRVYRRNPLDGRLKLAGKHLHQPDVIDGLKSISALVFAPGGDQLFTASTDTVPGFNNNDAVGHYSIAGVDLSVISIPDVQSIRVGDSLRLAITISNDGTENASGVAIISRIPDGTGVVEVVPDTGSCSFSEGIIRCEPGDLSAGVTTSVDVVLTATTVGNLDAEVSVFANQRDFDMTNNSDTGSVIILGASVTEDASSGGGGAFGWLSVFLLAGVPLARRISLRKL